MEPKRSSDIDLFTLVIAAVASAAAAYLTSEIWAGGTLLTAAITPVIVALVKEGLARPVDRVTTLRERKVAEPGDPTVPPAVTVYSTRSRAVRRWWKVGLASGLAAFVLVAAIFTVPELVTGKSLGRGGDHATTFFGGTSRKKSSAVEKKKKRHREKPASPGATATPTEKAAATETPDAVTPTPSPTVEATVTSVPTVTATATASPAG